MCIVCDKGFRLGRRGLLGGAGALAASSVLPQPGRAQNARHIIDVHYHIMPPKWVRDPHIQAVWEKTYLPGIFRDWTPERAIEEMDRNGIATAVCSVTNPGVWLGDAALGRRLARDWNEYAAQLRDAHPGRFGFFATIPLPDQEGSLAEIAYALDVLKADGIALMTSYGDKWPGDKEFDPVFVELNRRKAVVYFHPNEPACCGVGLMRNVPGPIIEYPTDTTRTITNLLFTGTVTRLRDIRFIFPHTGGTITVLAGRIEELARNSKPLTEKLPNGFVAELARFYYDIANSATPATMAAIMKLAPTSHLLFGSDYPFVAIPVTEGGLEKLGLSASEVAAIERENALALMPELARV